ncbi:hypothetical protein EDD16DRAFT_1626189 [Pisolithus croceorrhizus]|nr:hypothetical protein EDD16DRAFT_1626189 [Pisolithus croceorrhizus]KAI6149989.1 hypothetical protein EDD17DRAFT_1642504 [Pisolithus thermaeus]
MKRCPICVVAPIAGASFFCSHTLSSRCCTLSSLLYPCSCFTYEEAVVTGSRLNTLCGRSCQSTPSQSHSTGGIMIPNYNAHLMLMRTKIPVGRGCHPATIP